MDDRRNRMKLRSMVRSFYDCQKLRIAVGNRIVANIRVKLGQDPGTKAADTLSPEGQKLLDIALLDHQRVVDTVALNKTFRRALNAIRTRENGVITDECEYMLIELYKTLLSREKQLEQAVSKMVFKHPVWRRFLKDVKGCGPLMAAVLITAIDPHRADTVSCIWKVAGVDVAPDGRGRSRRPEHLVVVRYKSKDGEDKERLALTFNPFLKTKLLGVLAPSFLIHGGTYRKVYDDYRRRLDNHVVHKNKSRGHKHRMAVRYMIKMFLKDLYPVIRECAGLPVRPPYSEEKLGYAPHTYEDTTFFPAAGRV